MSSEKIKALSNHEIVAPWTEVKMLKHGDTVMWFLENLHRDITNQD